jgi:hypothetical protein
MRGHLCDHSCKIVDSNDTQFFNDQEGCRAIKPMTLPQINPSPSARVFRPKKAIPRPSPKHGTSKIEGHDLALLTVTQNQKISMVPIKIINE